MKHLVSGSSPSGLHQEEPDSHFLEEVPVGDDLQLLQDEKDSAADEEGLVFGQGLVEQQQVSLTETQFTCEITNATWGHFLSCHSLCLPHRFGDICKLHEVVFPQELMSRHVTLKPQAGSDWGDWSKLVSTGLKWPTLVQAGLKCCQLV